MEAESTKGFFEVLIPGRTCEGWVDVEVLSLKGLFDASSLMYVFDALDNWFPQCMRESGRACRNR